MVKIPALVRVNLGLARVYRFPSQSRPELYHYVFRFDDDRGVQCTCEGWQYNKNCKHVRDIPDE